jgi:hypothetical protein
MTELLGFTWVQQMSTFKLILLWLGPGLEIIGILLILFPDAWPWLNSLGRRLYKLIDAMATLFDRIGKIVSDLGRRPSTGSSVFTGERPRVLIMPGENALIEEKVKFLFDKHREITAAIDVLLERAEKTEKDTADRFEQTRREVETWTQEAIKQQLERYRALRGVATAFLVAGLACQAFANFINEELREPEHARRAVAPIQ